MFESKNWEDQRIKYFGSTWFMQIAHVDEADEASVDITPLNGIVISKDLAYCLKMHHATEGKIIVRELKEIMDYADYESPTELNYGDNGGKKDYYTLTEQQLANSIQFIKNMMTIFMDTYGHRKDQSALIELKKQVASLPATGTVENLNNAQMFMSTYFEYQTPYTQFREKTPQLNIRFQFDGEGW